MIPRPEKLPGDSRISEAPGKKALRNHTTPRNHYMYYSSSKVFAFDDAVSSSTLEDHDANSFLINRCSGGNNADESG